MRCRCASAKLPCTVFYNCHADDCYNQLTKSKGDDKNTSDEIDIQLYCDETYLLLALSLIVHSLKLNVHNEQLHFSITNKL